MTKKKTNKIDEGFLDALIGDTGAAGLRSMFKKGMNRQAQLAQDMFLKDFIGDAVSSLNAGIKGGFIDPTIRGGTTAATANNEPEDSMAVKTAKSRTGTQPAGTPKAASPAAPGGAPAPGTPATTTTPTVPGGIRATPTSPVVPPKPGIKPAPGAAPAPKAAPAAPKAAPASNLSYDQLRAQRVADAGAAKARVTKQFGKNVPSNVQAANRVPDDISESAYYKKLNALFESIFEATGGQSIAAYLTGWFNKYMGGVDWATHKATIEPLIQNVEDTYDKDKGYKAIQQLANAAFALAKTSDVMPDGAKNAQPPAGNANGGQQGGQQGGPQPGQQASAPANAPTLDEIAKALPNMQLRELEYIRDSVESAIEAKKKPASNQTQYMGKIAPNARAATKPASPLSAPTVPSRGTVKSTGAGAGPAGGITSGGAGAITRESRRPRR